METNREEQRWNFVMALQAGQWSMTELCERYGVSRPTGYKWLQRADEGTPGFVDRSRAPARCPHRTPASVERQILKLRDQYGWGAKKLIRVLERRHPETAWPARSTVNAILDRHGRLRKNRRRRRRWEHPGAAALGTDRPNQIWPADFKGQFKTRDGKYCYPLTVTDPYSRKLLACRALPSPRTKGTRAAFLRLFREAGLPEAIRTDNGAPFASTAIHGLCPLNVWWMQLGIVHQRIQPGSPQQNGQHERMHKDLKREATRPPGLNLRGQQRKLDQFQQRFNDERPHEALGGDLPNERWEPSPREYPARVTPPEYPGHLEVRRVSGAGLFRLGERDVFLSSALANEPIGLEPVDDGIWSIVYYRTLLGRINERTGEITGAMV